MTFTDMLNPDAYRQVIGELSLVDLYREQNRFGDLADAWEKRGHSGQEEAAKQRVTLLQQEIDRRYREGLH